MAGRGDHELVMRDAEEQAANRAMNPAIKKNGLNGFMPEKIFPVNYYTAPNRAMTAVSGVLPRCIACIFPAPRSLSGRLNNLLVSE